MDTRNENTNSETVLNEPNQPDKNVFVLKAKIEDMMSYGYKQVRQFSWRDKEIAAEIKGSLLKMYRLVIDIEKSYYKKTTLQDLDKELAILRHFVRFASNRDNFDDRVPKKDKKTGETVRNASGEVVLVQVAPPLSFHKYEVWTNMLREIGKLIGGYMHYAKSIK